MKITHLTRMKLDRHRIMKHALAEQCRMELEIIKNRETIDLPLRCDEMMVTIPRDKYKQLLEHTYKRLVDLGAYSQGQTARAGYGGRG